MPFKKGQSGNPKGAPARSITNIKWEVIDHYVNEATRRAFDILDGIDDDLAKIDDPKDRMDAKLKAIGHLIKLAPERVDMTTKGEPITGFNYVLPHGTDNTSHS